MGDIHTLRELYDARRLDEAWVEYERLRAEEPVDAEGHLYGALAAYRSNRPREGRMAINRAQALSPVGSVGAKVQFTSGILAREAGDTILAVQEFEGCLTLLSELPELSGLLRGPALYNMALALQFIRDRKPEALGTYLLAVAEFEASGMDDYRRQALQNAAWVCVDIGDCVQAAELLDQSAPLCKTESALWVQRVTHAHRLCQEREWTGSARLCEWILKAPDVQVEVQSLAAAVAADALYQQGNHHDAAVLGAHAVDLALKCPDARCLSIATQVHTRAKRAAMGAS